MYEFIYIFLQNHPRDSPILDIKDATTCIHKPRYWQFGLVLYAIPESTYGYGHGASMWHVQPTQNKNTRTYSSVQSMIHFSIYNLFYRHDPWPCKSDEMQNKTGIIKLQCSVRCTFQRWYGGWLRKL